MKLKFFLPLLALVACSCAFTACSSDDDDSNESATVIEYDEDALMLEGFTLDNMEPLVSRASAEEDFPEIKFLVFFKNNAELKSARKYDVGVALYDENNNQVKTYPLYNDFNLQYNHDYKMDDKVIITKDVKDGTYMLKPICRVSGTEKWEDFNLSDALPLTLIVANNQIKMKEAFEGVEGSMKVNSIDVKGNDDESFTFSAKLDLSSTCKNTYIPVYLAQKNADESYKKLTGALWTKNRTITLSYTPYTPGKDTYYIVTPLSKEPIAEFNVTIKGSIFYFTINNVANEVEGILEDNSIKGTFYVESYNDKVLNGDMYVMLGTLDMTTFQLSVDTLFERPDEYQLIQLNTPAMGEQAGEQAVPFEFNHLNYDSYYSITYGVRDEDGRFKEIQSNDYFELFTTPSAPGDQ